MLNSRVCHISETKQSHLQDRFLLLLDRLQPAYTDSAYDNQCHNCNYCHSHPLNLLSSLMLYADRGWSRVQLSRCGNHWSVKHRSPNCGNKSGRRRGYLDLRWISIKGIGQKPTGRNRISLEKLHEQFGNFLSSTVRWMSAIFGQIFRRPGSSVRARV